MTPEQLAARVLADVHPHKEQLDVWADELIADLAMRGGLEVQDYDEKLAVLSDIKEKLALSADHCRDNALAAIARHLAPGDDLVERLETKAAMIALGEKIAWGSDTAIMQEAAARLSALTAERDQWKAWSNQNATAAMSWNAQYETAEAEAATLRDRLARMEGVLQLRDEIAALEKLCDHDCDNEDCVRCFHYPEILEQKRNQLAALTDGGTE